MATAYSRGTPAHLWIVGIVSLLWNCFGGYDYVMSMTGNLEYFQMMGFGPTEVAYVAAMPAWAKACGRLACGPRCSARCCCCVRAMR